MILLDTNVLSAVMSRRPDGNVVDWLNAQDSAGLFLSAITIAEIGYGLEILPTGARRRSLEERFESFVAAAFAQRVLAFDEPAARRYAEIMGRRKRAGRPMAALDGQIAAIARAHRLAVATRNVRDFEDCGVALIDPFSPP